MEVEKGSLKRVISNEESESHARKKQHTHLEPRVDGRSHNGHNLTSTATSNAVSPSSIASPSPRYDASSSHRAAHSSSASGHKKFVGCSRITEYEVDDKLGEGTFGEVHKARRKKTGEQVALKRILMHNDQDGMPITALREIKILKQLNHVNVIPLTDIAVQKGSGNNLHGSVYMVFPYMDHDLAGLLENPLVRLSLPLIKLYMKQLLEGTYYLHENKILHRDMKAANLLINNQGVLKIADFGLSRPFAEDTEREYTNLVVTRWYRPPELLLGERKYTTAIDMWGVGCIIAEMFKGRPILQGSTDIDQLEKTFRLCGSPTEDTKPNWKSLPNASTVTFGPYSRRVKEEFSKYGHLAVDLIDKLLALDPKKRMSAYQALDHDWFWTDPMPAEVGKVPVYDASHEYDRRKAKEAAHKERVKEPGAPQHQALPSVYQGRMYDGRSYNRRM